MEFVSLCPPVLFTKSQSSLNLTLHWGTSVCHALLRSRGWIFPRQRPEFSVPRIKFRPAVGPTELRIILVPGTVSR